MWQLDGGLQTSLPTHLRQRYPKNHTSPTQIITVQGAGRHGTPPVGEHKLGKGTGVR